MLLISSSKDVKLQDESLIHVYFNDLVSTLYRKDIYQNWLSILGNKYIIFFHN